MTLDRQELRPGIERAFARDDVLDAYRRDSRDFGQILWFLRFHGNSYATITDLTGIPQSRLSEHGSGTRQPSLDTLKRFADGLDLPDAARVALGLAPRVCSGIRS